MSAETPVKEFMLLSVGTFVQRLKSMTFIEELFENACESIKVTSPSTRLHLVPELDPELFMNMPYATTSDPLVPTSTETKLEQFTNASAKIWVLVDDKDGMLTVVKS